MEARREGLGADPGRPIPVTAPPCRGGETTYTPFQLWGQPSNGCLTTRVFSLLFGHLDSAFTLGQQPSYARNGRPFV